jgi:hypothetical protein
VETVGQPLGAPFFSRLVNTSFSVSAELLLPPDDSAAPTFRSAIAAQRRAARSRFTASFHLDVVSEAKVGPVFGPC